MTKKTSIQKSTKYANALTVTNKYLGELNVADGSELATQFVHIEKNLTALGFFTPTSKELKEPREKIVLFNRVKEGRKIEASIKIVTGGKYGLPGTADLDKYLALQKIINNIQKRDGTVTNPISFSSYELLALLGKDTGGGWNYKSVEEWLDRMYATTIESKNAVFYAGQKKFGKESIRVFDRRVSVGHELESGVIADRNYVWLSAWQLENINNNYLVPIDFDEYRTMKNPVAKILVPLLQVWLYATRTDQVFEKRYDELCQILGIKQYSSPSLIKQKLSPAMSELHTHGYLAGWELEKTKNGAGYKVILRHGDKFFHDRRLMGKQEIQTAITPPVPCEEASTELLDELLKRGVDETEARKLLRELPADQPVLDQLDYLDDQISRANGKFRNPAGFIVVRVRAGFALPHNFETRRERAINAARRRAEGQAEMRQIELERDYQKYRELSIINYIEEKLTEPERAQVLEKARGELAKDYPYILKWKDEQLNHVIMCGAVKIVEPHIELLSFNDFMAQNKPAPPPHTKAAGAH